MPQPIKRHEALQDLSRDHHAGLLLCFKVREGLKRNVEPERILRYCRHFYKQHLEEHFREEEEILFPSLGNKHPMVQKALEQHRQLNRLFASQTASGQVILEIEKLLKEHIRFEERELFNEIQQELGAEKLKLLNASLSHQRTSAEDWEDDFWN